MSAVLWLMAVGVYAAGWLVSAVVCCVHGANHPRRHACPNGNSAGYCMEHHRPDCALVSGLTPSFATAVSVIALAWPLVALPAVVYLLAKRHMRPSADLTAIARMERELGMTSSP